MLGRAILFLVLGVIEGAALGAASVRVLISIAEGAEGSLLPIEEAVMYWSIVGASHGIVLFLASLGETPVIVNLRTGKPVIPSLARGFDYRRFGHRIPYIAVAYRLVVSFVIAPLLAQQLAAEVTSSGFRLVAGIGLCFVWTAIAMLANTVIVSQMGRRLGRRRQG